MFTPLLTQLYSRVSEVDIRGKSCSFILLSLPVVSGALSGRPLFTCKPSEDWSCKRSDAAVSNTSTTPWGERGRFWSQLHNYPTEITLLPAEVWAQIHSGVTEVSIWHMRVCLTHPRQSWFSRFTLVRFQIKIHWNRLKLTQPYMWSDPTYLSKRQLSSVADFFPLFPHKFVVSMSPGLSPTCTTTRSVGRYSDISKSVWILSVI